MYDMPWIILTKKLPVRPSPPKLSIFWAEPAPNINLVQSQKEHYYDKTTGKYVDWLKEYDPDKLPNEFIDIHLMDEPNAEKWVKINFMEHEITVQAHEFNVLTASKMRDYVFGIPGEDIATHELVENADKTSARLLETAMNTDLRSVYDAALLDGCTPQMAKYVAMMQEGEATIGDEFFEFPPVGWYRCKREFALVFCDEWELEENPPMSVDELDNIKHTQMEENQRWKKLTGEIRDEEDEDYDEYESY